MNRLVEELKVRARIRLNAGRRVPGAAAAPAELRLRHCLEAVAREAGFRHWDQARQVLGGLARPGDDHGSFWYDPACATLLNRWFASHAEARAAQAGLPGAVLVPYRRQVILADADYLRVIGLAPDDPALGEAGFDLLTSAGQAAWESLAWCRLQAMRASS